MEPRAERLSVMSQSCLVERSKHWHVVGYEGADFMS